MPHPAQTVTATPRAKPSRALVLALNPSIDAEWSVTDVLWGEKNPVQAERRWAGGKGINVARWLRHLGARAKLLLPLGGASGRELAGHLRAESLPASVVRLRAPTRVNVIVTTAGGRQLRFNPPGPPVSGEEWRRLVLRVNRALDRGGWLVLSGSLPRGVPADAYARLTRLARRVGARVALDCDGDALARAVRARPFLVKPNEHELALWSGHRLRGAGDLRRAALALAETTGEWVLVSRGPRPALLVHARAGVLLTARPPAIRVRNTVGAGDALLAGVVRQLEERQPAAEWLRWGLATGAAAAERPAGELASARRVAQLAARIHVHPV